MREFLLVSTSHKEWLMLDFPRLRQEAHLPPFAFVISRHQYLGGASALGISTPLVTIDPLLVGKLERMSPSRSEDEFVS